MKHIFKKTLLSSEKMNECKNKFLRKKYETKKWKGKKCNLRKNK